MPVLSDQPHHNGIANLPSAKLHYLVLSLVVALILIIFHTRRRRNRTQTMPPPLHNEKGLPTPSSPTSEQSASLAKARIPPPNTATPPSGSSPSPSTTMSMSASASFDSFEPSFEMPPRRRSYTKNMPDGGEVSGEIVVAEGWRRHTRVFGGGVCKACEESEKRMTA